MSKGRFLLCSTLLALCFILHSAHCDGPVRHFVAWGFNDDVSQTVQTEVLVRCLGLKNACKRSGQPYILALDGGYTNSKEGFQQNTTQAFAFTFKNEDDRDYFVGRLNMSAPYAEPYDPVHDAFKLWAVPFMSNVIAIDYNILNATASSAAPPSQEGYVHHFVSWSFGPDVNTTQQQEVVSNYLGLFNVCVKNDTGKKYILAMDGGYTYPASKQNLEQGMVQGFLVTFASAADRDFFVGGPLPNNQSYPIPFDAYHNEFKAYVGPLLGTPVDHHLIVIDFEVMNNTFLQPQLFDKNHLPKWSVIVLIAGAALVLVLLITVVILGVRLGSKQAGYEMIRS